MPKVREALFSFNPTNAPETFGSRKAFAIEY
jgi:hypothetical protein